MEKSVSRVRSAVGRVWSPAGATSFRPRHSPAMMRIKSPPLDFEGRGTMRSMVGGFLAAKKSPSTAFGGPPPLQMQGRKSFQCLPEAEQQLALDFADIAGL